MRTDISCNTALVNVLLEAQGRCGSQALKEMEWDAEKCRLGRSKLYDKFKGDIEYDRVVVRGFR